MRNLSESQKQTQRQGDPAVRRQRGTERMAVNGVIDDQNTEQMAGGEREHMRVTVAQIQHQ